MYTGGAWSTSSDTGAYSTSTSGYGTTREDFSNPGFAACSGEMRATFTWVPDYIGDDPPASCVIEETSDAGALWQLMGGSDGGSVYADCGLPGDPPFYSGDDMSGSLGNSGARTTVRTDPGPSFYVTCTPTASATLADSGFAEAGVTYTAIARPVILNLAGTLQSGSGLSILIGQECQASTYVQGAQYLLLNRSWSITGNVFSGYSAHGPDISLAIFYPLDVSDMGTGSYYCIKTFTWLRPSGNLDTVACSADAYINGNYIGRVVGRRDATVLVPGHTFDKQIGSTVVDGRLVAKGVAANSNGSEWGIKWTGRVDTPGQFRIYGWTCDSGTWNFVQAVTYCASYAALDGSTYISNLNPLGRGLDTMYPYRTDGWGPPDAPDYGYAADDSEHSDGDAPFVDLQWNMHSVQVSPVFETYMMYLPPTNGIGVHWVPLHRLDWNWTASAIKNNGDWADPANWTVSGGINVVLDQSWSVHPLWDKTVSAGNWQWLVQ